MLIEPASKVSVPLTVVMRMRSKVPERVFEPVANVLVPELPPSIADEDTHKPVALFSNASVAIPRYVYAAFPSPINNKPVVLELFNVFASQPALTYPVICTPPEVPS